MQMCAHLVEIGKFYQTHVFLQNFVLVQPAKELQKIRSLLIWIRTNFTHPLSGLSPTRGAGEGEGEAEAWFVDVRQGRVA